MLDRAFILFHLRLFSDCALCVSDVRLIDAIISFGVEHSHWSLKELFPLLCSSSNETSGVQLGFDMKEDG